MEQKKYWFKRRRFGWGYVPVTWEGWLVVVLFVAFIIYRSMNLPPEPTPNDSLWHIGSILAAGAILIAVSIAKGPSPRWRWGKRPNDDPDEDF